MIGDRWGVTQAEVSRHYPCDDIVASPGIQLWRGVTAQAPAAAVWPWLRQLRIAPYSYDWVDNLGHRSPRVLHDLPDPRPGDPFSRTAGKFNVGRVRSVVPGEQLTASIMGALMSYVLVSAGPSTRLLLKVVVAQRSLAAVALALGDLPMARKQLRTLARLAETSGAD
jgi:hypothetical protein